MSDTEIKLIRKVGEFGSQEATATRNLSTQAAPEPTTEIEPAIEVSIDRTIKEAFHESFRIGTAGDFPTRYSDQELEVAAEHFNAVTPENCMKPAPIHPAEDEWRFERSDALVDWAIGSNLSIHGHTLVWHAQTSDWFFAGGSRKLGNLLWRYGDVKLIDGFFVNGAARTVGWFSRLIRHFQSGYIYHYAFAMIIGVFALITWFVRAA